ncbi:MAG: aldehyde dehydrogenase family protein, partial [Chloroflexi bacterium]|nr:aldehyde dehydrogenase family protein [Chloroflexota bacterium]
MERGLFINGEWRHAANCARLETVDPATEEVFDEVACGGIVDIDLAVAAARTAYEAGWGKTPPCERAALLRAIAA